jgi:hypothetical protein
MVRRSALSKTPTLDYGLGDQEDLEGDVHHHSTKTGCRGGHGNASGTGASSFSSLFRKSLFSLLIETDAEVVIKS